MAAAAATATATAAGSRTAIPQQRPPPSAFSGAAAANHDHHHHDDTPDDVAITVTVSQHQQAALETEVDYEIGDLSLREEQQEEEEEEGEDPLAALRYQHLRRIGRPVVTVGANSDAPPHYYEALDGNNNPPPSSLLRTNGFCYPVSLGLCLCRSIRKLYSRSLAAACTTPCLAAWGIPVLIVASHLLFAHGQTADMWKLASAAHVDAWYNASSFEARSVFRLAGIGDPYNLRIQVHQNSTVQTFTYYTAIQELWDAAGMENVNLVLPRLASILLIVFSGVWPHLKLLLLNFHWLFRPNSPRMYWWLATLGKWSLSDVLVVCLMLGILHIDWNVQPDVVLHGIIREAPTIMKILPDLYTPSDMCTYLLARPCTERRTMIVTTTTDTMVDAWDTTTTSTTTPWRNESHVVHPYQYPPNFLGWDLECSACLKFVKSSLAHPQTFQSTVQGVADGIDTSGGGLVSLRVQGLAGIYSFCAAVVLSIALSCLVDVYALRADAAAASPAPSRPRRRHHHQHQVTLSLQRSRVASCERPLLDAEQQQERDEGEEEEGLGADAATAGEDEEASRGEVGPRGDVEPVCTAGRVRMPATPPQDNGAVGGIMTLHRRSFDPSLSSPDEDGIHWSHHRPAASDGINLVRSTSSLSSSTYSTEDDSPPATAPCQSFWLWSTMMLSVVTAAIVWKTLQSPSLAREVTGVGPHWLQQVTGVQWDDVFSLVGLSRSVGEAGGMDQLLQGTFAWFCVVGPAIRAGLCALAMCCPRRFLPCSSPGYALLLTAIDFVGAFCAVEVLAVAAYLVHALIPSTTATIVNLPQCAQIAPENSTTACFQVLLEPQPNFQWLGIGTILLLVVAQACQWLLAPKNEPRQRRRS